MNTRELTRSAAIESPETAVLRDSLRAALMRIGARRAAIAGGLAAVAAGVAFNWGWLTAIGVAPVLLSVAPCAAMCALGLCMPKMMGGNSCAAEQSGSPEPRPSPNAIQPPETN